MNVYFNITLTSSNEEFGVDFITVILGVALIGIRLGAWLGTWLRNLKDTSLRPTINQ